MLSAWYVGHTLWIGAVSALPDDWGVDGRAALVVEAVGVVSDAGAEPPEPHAATSAVPVRHSADDRMSRSRPPRPWTRLTGLCMHHLGPFKIIPEGGKICVHPGLKVGYDCNSGFSFGIDL